MYSRILAASVLALGVATSAMADPLTLSVSPKGPRIVTVYTSVQDRSEDGIRPDGTINVDQTLVGSTNRSPMRIQCDSNSSTSVMSTNTFDMPNSNCP